VRSALYTGTLVHARRTPKENVFRYPVCFYLLDLDELPALDRGLRFFSYNGRNLVTLRDRDHLGDPARTIRENVLDFLDGRGIDLAGGRILLLTNLRVLGYVFNPVSFYYCYGPDGELRCMVAEVSNTFGEMHPYLLGEGQRTGEHAYTARKRMHVSPFFSLDQEYRFFFSEPGERLHARVDVWEGGQRRLGSVLAGTRQPLLNSTLGNALLRYPLMPQQVISRIHWQALRLYLKGVPFHPKPPFVPGVGSVRP
jgi:DUF1365 family protein